jgi:hypothetical protein
MQHFFASHMKLSLDIAIYLDVSFVEYSAHIPAKGTQK